MIVHSPNAQASLDKSRIEKPKEELERLLQQLIGSIQSEGIPGSEDTVVDLSQAQTELKRKNPRWDMIKDNLGKATKFVSAKAPKLLSTAKTILDLVQTSKGMGT